MTHRELHSVLGSVPGITDPASWAEPGHTSRVDVCIEIHEGERLAYVGGLSENDTVVRVDLDRDGWARLRDLADDVVRRMDQASAAELS